ncbi:MAG: hypothetical protein M3R71_01320 [Actinomycetota bacterium]|nr:hypothetical protein [Actinomycetota bacterium]
MARTANDNSTETVDGHRLLYAERLTPESAAASRKETRALLDLLEKTRQVIESEEAPAE